jgi:ribonuclease-3
VKKEANSYEAVLGAIYLDSGYDEAKKFVTHSLLNTFDQILEEGSWMDPKSYLQELAQSKEGLTPIYKVLDEAGPDHDKAYTVGVFINGQIRGRGSGPSKQAGQVAAAKAALEQYKL